jgi:AraC-like DNA-binding protein
VTSPETTSPRVFASVVVVLFAFAESLGVPRARLFELTGLDEAALADPDELVPYEHLVTVWRELLARRPGEPLGLRYAPFLEAGTLGVVGYAVRHARDGHQALDLTLRFVKLADPFLGFRVVRRGDFVEMHIEHEPRVVEMVEPLEMLVLATVRMARSLFQGDPRPSEVCFRHRARHPRALYTEVVGDTPVRFEASFDGVVFPAALLDLPLAAADARMSSYLVTHAETLLERTSEQDAPLEERARRAIRAALPSGEVTAADVAKTLGTSTRSLQRALQEKGTSLSHEVDEARKERAMVLLRRPELTVAEVAFMLGYAESRVFLRSFRRWTGKTPTELRRAWRAE